MFKLEQIIMIILVIIITFCCIGLIDIKKDPLEILNNINLNNLNMTQQQINKDIKTEKELKTTITIASAIFILVFTATLLQTEEEKNKKLDMLIEQLYEKSHNNSEEKSVDIIRQ